MALITEDQFDPAKFEDKPRCYIGASMVPYCPKRGYHTFQWSCARRDEDTDGVPAPLPFSVKSMMRMKTGNYLEPMVVAMLEAQGYVLEGTCENQMCVSTGGITGHPDGVVVKDPEGVYDEALLEIKTSHPYAVKKVVREGTPQEYYRDQVTPLMKGLHLKGCIFIYMDLMNRELFRIDYDYEDWRLEPLLAKAKLILDGVDGGPPDPAPIASWECPSCPWRNICDKGKA